MSELERFQSNQEQGRAPGLWLTLHVDLGERPDETLDKFLSVIGSWITLAEQVWAVHGPWPGKEAWPPPEQIEPLLPSWLTENVRVQSREQVHGNDWGYLQWLIAMENRCWEWWGYQRDGHTLTVQLVVDGFPCPMDVLVYLARAAGAVSVDVEE